MTDRACAPVVLFTGPPAAGKSTLATALLPTMQGRWPVETLDGDEVRLWLSDGLGSSRADRDRNIARIARVACLLARNGVAVLVAVVAPYAAARALARALATSQAIPFFEVFVSAPLAVLTQRDPKGMYRRAWRRAAWRCQRPRARPAGRPWVPRSCVLRPGEGRSHILQAPPFAQAGPAWLRPCDEPAW